MRGLGWRTLPQQARAQRTVGRLLSTASQLLEEVGVDAFNTNLLAERAGVGIRTVYRYFPNKWSVLAAVAERAYHVSEQQERGLAALADPLRPWGACWEAMIDAYAEAARSTPEMATLVPSLRAQPELTGLVDAQARWVEAGIAHALARRGACADDAEREAAAQILSESAGAVLDAAAARHGEVPDDLVAELKRMHHCYLAGRLGPMAGDSG